MRWSPLVLTVVAAGCAVDRREIGVEVYSNDTIPAHFTVELTGSLQVGLRSESFRMLPDKSLLLQTPAALVVQKGAGTMTIKTASAQRLAVQPIGTPADSSDFVAVIGTVLKVDRPSERERVAVVVEKP